MSDGIVLFQLLEALTANGNKRFFAPETSSRVDHGHELPVVSSRHHRLFSVLYHVPFTINLADSATGRRHPLTTAREAKM